MVCALKNVQIPYGVIELGDHGEISEITEKPEMSFLTNTGLYVVEPGWWRSWKRAGCRVPDIVEKYRLAGEKVGCTRCGSKAGWTWAAGRAGRYAPQAGRQG